MRRTAWERARARGLHGTHERAGCGSGGGAHKAVALVKRAATSRAPDREVEASTRDVSSSCGGTEQKALIWLGLPCQVRGVRRRVDQGAMARRQEAWREALCVVALRPSCAAARLGAVDERRSR